MTYSKKALTPDERDFCLHTIAPNAFAALVINSLVRNEHLTCVRASDGERALITHYLHDAELASFLRDDDWLTRYGVKGADMKQMGHDILEAGNAATFLAPTISGLWLPQFKVVDLFTPRKSYVDIFYPYSWGNAKDMLCGVLNAANKVFLAHHKYEQLNKSLKDNKSITAELTGYPLASWTQHDEVLQAVQQSKPNLVLVCGGPHGKVLVHRIGQLGLKCVVLDTGSAVTNAW